MDLFQVDVTDAGDVMLRGELDASNVDMVREVAGAHAERDPLVLDVSQLTFLDAAGFSAVASIATARPGRPVVLRQPRPNVARVLGLLAATRPENLSVELASTIVRTDGPGRQPRSAARPSRGPAEMVTRLRARIGRGLPTLRRRIGDAIRATRRLRWARSAPPP